MAKYCRQLFVRAVTWFSLVTVFVLPNLLTDAGGACKDNAATDDERLGASDDSFIKKSSFTGPLDSPENTLMLPFFTRFLTGESSGEAFPSPTILPAPFLVSQSPRPPPARV